MRKKGDRVGAICGNNEGVIEFFGYGTYEGNEIPPKGIKFFGVDLYEAEHRNPKIVLDDGSVVWGCECWFGDETRVKKVLEGKVVKIVKIEDYRKECEIERKVENGQAGK